MKLFRRWLSLLPIIVLSLLISAAAARSDDTATLSAPQAAPPTPTGFAPAGAGRSTITLVWNDTTNETGYNVYRWDGSAYVLVASVGANIVTYTDTVTCGTQFYYKLSAFNADGESAKTAGNLSAASTTCFAPDAYEPDNSADQAVLLLPGVAQERSVAPMTDTDWVKFTLGDLSGVTLTTSSSTGTTGDTELSLFGDNLVLIDYNNDYANTRYSQIDHTCDMGGLRAGTYYAKVRSDRSASMIGGYYLNLAVVACAVPTPSATATVSPTATAVGTPAPSTTATTPPSSTPATPTTPTATAVSSSTPTTTASATATTAPTNTPVTPTATATTAPTNTPVTPTTTASATATTAPSSTPTNTPVTPTVTASATATTAPTNTPVTPTTTASATATTAPTNTPVTPTSATPTTTASATPSSTATATASPTATATATSTAVPTTQPVTPTATGPLQPSYRVYLPALINSKPAAARSAPRTLALR